MQDLLDFEDSIFYFLDLSYINHMKDDFYLIDNKSKILDSKHINHMIYEKGLIYSNFHFLGQFYMRHNPQNLDFYCNIKHFLV